MNRVKILVCDDDEGIRLVIPRMLSAIGVTVVTASTFAGAMEIMAQRPPPDFIFLDLGLPDSPNKMNTLSHLDDLRAFNTQAPIVVITGSQDEKLEQIAKSVGADAFRNKQDLTGQRDLWVLMKEAIDARMAHGDTATEAMTKILTAISSKMTETLAA